MRNGVRSIALIALSTWLVAFASAQEEYTLKLQVKEGDIFKYRFTMELTFGQQSAIVTMNMTNKVLKVDGDGNIIMESSSSDGTIKFGEDEIPLPPSPATRITYKPDRTPIKVEGGETPEGSLRMARLNAYFLPSKPVKVGDKWSAELKSEGSAPALKADFELVAKEKIGDTETLKVKFTVKEVGENVVGGTATLTGHSWIDPKTGMLVRLNASAKGLPVAGSTMPLDGTITIERIP